jgi:hypothetical protein
MGSCYCGIGRRAVCRNGDGCAGMLKHEASLNAVYNLKPERIFFIVMTLEYWIPNGIVLSHLDGRMFITWRIPAYRL